MPALFSFLGGIANGYNESKAAEAKALQEERLENKKLKGRMELAKFEAAAQREQVTLQAMITNLIKVKYGDVSEDAKAEASRELEDYLSRYPDYRGFANEMESAEQAPVNPENVPPPPAATGSTRPRY